MKLIFRSFQAINSEELEGLVQAFLDAQKPKKVTIVKMVQSQSYSPDTKCHRVQLSLCIEVPN